MPVLITKEPANSIALKGRPHSFSVIAAGGTLEYQWYVNGEPQEGATSPDFSSLIATEENSGAIVTVVVTDTDDNTTDVANPAQALTEVGSGVAPVSLLWNYNNNTFSWKDDAVEQESGDEFELMPVRAKTYGFSPGFQQRWEDYKQGAYLENTWEAETQKAWSDTLSKSSDKEMIVVAGSQAYKAEKIRNRKNSIKKYFVERTQIDFDGLVPEFRSGKIKSTKRFVLDMQADQRQISRGSTSNVLFYVGWSMNLMEDPNYKPPVIFDLQARDFGGSYKLDYRSSGRYMGMYFDLTDTSQLSFTGGEVEVAQTSGR